MTILYLGCYNNPMKKNLSLIKMIFLDQLEYPGEVFYQLSLALVPLIVAIYLWLAVYQQGKVFGNFNLSSMITYYVVVMFLDRLLGHPAFMISEMVENGELSSFLVKPFHFLKYVFVRSLTKRVTNIIISLPVLVILLILLRQYLIFPPNLHSIILFGISCIIAIILFYLLGILLGLVSMWTLEIGSIFYFYHGALGFLGGSMLPLSFFPAAFSNVLTYLPFKYLYYFPAQIYLGNISVEQISQGFVVAGFWIIVLYLTVTLVFKMGLRRYSSFGN